MRENPERGHSSLPLGLYAYAATGVALCSVHSMHSLRLKVP